MTQQVNDIENLISDGVDLLIVAAIDGESLTTVLDSADEAGIPVISYDRLIMNTKAIDYYVSFDNYTVGVLQGQYVIDTLGLAASFPPPRRNRQTQSRPSVHRRRPGRQQRPLLLQRCV